MMRICPECRESVMDEDDEMCPECRRRMVDSIVNRFFMVVAVAIVLVLTAFFLTGCTALDGYDRTHSVSYQDAEGRSLNYNLNLRSTKGYAK